MGRVVVVVFCVGHQVDFGKSVYCCGSWPGGWEIPTRMFWSHGHVWNGAVAVPIPDDSVDTTSMTVEFKFLVGDTDSRGGPRGLAWEHFCGNRRLLLPAQNGALICIDTTWDNPERNDIRGEQTGWSFPVTVIKNNRVVQLRRHVVVDFTGFRYVDVYRTASTSPPNSVLYCHDGQNLFDPSTCASTGIDWGLDEALAILGSNVLVVAIWCSACRYQEYSPGFINAAGDAYMNFVVTTVKPMIETDYNVHLPPAQTFLMGSSMGGIISLWMLCKYPQLFGGAACLSIHLILSHGEFVQYLAHHPEEIPTGKRIYLDSGTIELDKDYPPLLDQLSHLLPDIGYTMYTSPPTTQESQPPMALVMVWTNHGHNEAYWRTRLHVPLAFLLPHT
ncbi:alpha/beta hydrolase [Pelomyxa schiedti]|nr:alpha/beta hydrolase [Pelomyxa schiedti]